ncbi:ABC transporter permease [Paracoccus sp. (in: a-proteobacteria)]|uniref:ABC transporter permease n=1 Tax=Paracoccus sp. TaxID=267 RepID=UPI0026DF1441|nr:FtsX-like permease family protein [Paracoccus sp. (in: a-proteobacteria)]MDO5368975.1 drug:proton antiporter [Paracoccus sp. (in: a-proteobacteria)]
MTTLRLAWTLARREMRGGLAGFRIFLTCLALAVAALAAVGTVRASIEAGLARNGAALLGGDAEVELTYRFATDAERAALDRIASAVSETAEFRSMVTVLRDGQSERALTQVKAVDDAYPLVGTVRLSPPIPWDQALSPGGTPGAVMERVLAERLGLCPGDGFRLGEQEFTLTAILDSFPDNAGESLALGPITILRRADLAQSGLLGPGTLFEAQYRLLLPAGTDLGTARAQAMAALEGAGARWRDARDGAPGLSGFVDRLGAFLILIGLSGLAVGGVGVSAAVRAWLDAKLPVIATLKSLGASRRVIFLTYLIQIGLMTALGIMLGLALGALLPLLLAPVIEARLPMPAAFGVFPGPLAEAALYGALAALAFALWPLALAADTRAAVLFRSAVDAGRRVPRPRYLAMIAVLAGLFLLAAAGFSGNWRLTLWTLGGVAGTLALLAVVALLAAPLAGGLMPLARRRPALRLALGALRTQRGDATGVVLSLGLGLAVLAVVGQIDGTLRRAIESEMPGVAPSFFFVDVQPDQIGDFLDLARGNPAVSRVEAAPMLRGVVTRINGRPAAEVAGDHWVVRGDRGLTYSESPPSRTTITAGEWWPAGYDGPPLISFSAEEAAEIGLSLGDTLTVSVLGRDITGTIASFRQVEFRNAGIGFVMSMNPAALQGAPHTWIATVYAGPEAETAILREIGDRWPNVTAIPVGEAIERVADLLAGIGAAVRWGAAATLVTGFAVLVGTALAAARARRYEAAILKTLGASRALILRSFALRAALLGLIAGIAAIAAGAVGGWAVARFVLDIDHRVIWSSAVILVAGGVIATLAAELAFALRALTVRPAAILRSE